MTMSFPVIAAIMLLMSHPDKANVPLKKLGNFPDADSSWTFDVLHAFARPNGPNEDELKPQVNTKSYALETYGDAWIYMHFTLHNVYMSGVDNNSSQPKEQSNPSGLRLSRREIHTHFAGSFTEARTTIAVRTATANDERGRRYGAGGAWKCPVVGLVLCEGGHDSFEVEDGEWSDENLVCPEEARGVAVFQKLLWRRFEKWGNGWVVTLRRLRSALDIDVSFSPLTS